MARNPYNAQRKVSLEWGSKARKEETRQRNLNKAADREAVEEQLDDLVPSGDELDALNCYDDGPEALDWYAEAFAAQFDDDPNPYHGDYSEI